MAIIPYRSQPQVTRHPFRFSLLSVVGTLALAAIPSASKSQVFNPVNGHYYQRGFVIEPIAWHIAATLARGTNYLGMQGHLASITSAEEQAVVTATAGGLTCWIGGYEDILMLDPIWRWQTNETSAFNAWAINEPNNVNGNEDFLCMAAGGFWYDVPANAPILYFISEHSPSSVKVKLVEFPANVDSPKTVKLQVTLKSPAGPQGVILTLYSDVPAIAANLPKTMSFSNGQTSKTVSFLVDQVASAQSGVVSVYGLKKKSVATTVNP
jgi:hypothetical protein